LADRQNTLSKSSKKPSQLLRWLFAYNDC